MKLFVALALFLGISACGPAATTGTSPRAVRPERPAAASDSRAESGGGSSSDRSHGHVGNGKQK